MWVVLIVGSRTETRAPEVSLSKRTREESRSEGRRNCNEALMLKNFQVKDQKVLKRLDTIDV